MISPLTLVPGPQMTNEKWKMTYGKYAVSYYKFRLVHSFNTNRLHGRDQLVCPVR